MFEFLSNKESVALSIAPSLRFISAGKQTKVIIDSGKDDLNQRIAQVVLDDETTQGINSLIIEGFDDIYTSFKKPKDGLIKDVEPHTSVSTDETKISTKTSKPSDDRLKQNPSMAMANKTSTTSSELDPLTLKDFLSKTYQEISDSKIKRIQDQIAEAFEYEEGVVMGSVYLSLENGEKQLLARPIYTVIPSEVDGKLQYVSTSQLQEFVEGEWTDEFSHSLTNMSDDAGQNDNYSPAIKARDDSLLSEKILHPTKTMLIAMLVVCGAVGYAGAVILSNATNDKVDSSSNASVYTANSIYSSPANEAIGPSVQQARYNRDGIPKAEEYAALEKKATQDLLKQMNIDITKNPADLGCLAQ